MLTFTVVIRPSFYLTQKGEAVLTLVGHLLVRLTTSEKIMFPIWRSLIFKLLKLLITSTKPQVQWIGTQELAIWLENTGKPKPIIIDARTRSEYAVSHLENAMRIDPDRPDLTSITEVSRDTPIVVYCSIGYRSAGIVARLKQAGFTDVYNLAGSIFQWANEGRPIFKEGSYTQFVHPYNAFWGKLLKSQYRYK